MLLGALDRLVADALGVARGVLAAWSASSRASRSISAALDSAASTIAWTWALAMVASDSRRPGGVSVVAGLEDCERLIASTSRAIAARWASTAAGS